MKYSISLIYVTFPNKEEASLLSKELINDNLIACSNITPINSCYVWEDKFESDNEFVGLFKTSNTKLEKAIIYIEAKHSYKTPCILSWQVQANKSYYEWINKETS